SIPLVYIVSRTGLPGLQRRLYGDAGRIYDSSDATAFRRRFSELRIGPDDVLVDGGTARHDDPRQISIRLARLVAAHPSGGVGEGAAVTGLRDHGDGIRVEIADGRSIAAERAIVCAGPLLLDGPWSDAARALRLRVKKIVALHVQQPPQPDDPV